MITVYTTPTCPQCVATKKWLDRGGVDYNVVDITKDSEAYALVKSKGYSQAPVVFSGKNHFSGFQVDKLDEIIANYQAAHAPRM